MVKKEIISGLNNAVLRGESIQRAIQTMINAGYNSQEVKEASRYVRQGVTGELEQAKEEKKEQKTKEQLPESPKQEIKKKLSKKLIVLGTILTIVIIFFLILMIFGEKLLSFLLK